MKIFFTLLLGLFCCNFLLAQTPLEKGLTSINKNSAEAIIQFLASDELQGREAGSRDAAIVAQYLAMQLKKEGFQPFFTDYFQPFQAVQQMGNAQARWESNPDSVQVIQQQSIVRRLQLRNVLGVLPGKIKDEFVVVGAHYDHLGIDSKIAGDNIFNGADDNASGVSAVLQIMHAISTANIQPLRTIIFAFWDGEEKGLLGSKYFTATFPYIKQVKSYMNFDMIGRNHIENNPQHVVFFYTAKHKIFEQWLRDAIRSYDLPLKPDYRAWENPVGGSDNGSFAKVGVPILWYHTDGHPDYHQPSDTPEKLNWEKLTAITKAAYYQVWKMANEPAY